MPAPAADPALDFEGAWTADPPRLTPEVVDSAIRKATNASIRENHPDATNGEIVYEIAYVAALRFDAHGVNEVPHSRDPDTYLGNCQLAREQAVDATVREAGFDPLEHADEIFEASEWATEDAATATIAAYGGGKDEEYALARAFRQPARQRDHCIHRPAGREAQIATNTRSRGSKRGGSGVAGPGSSGGADSGDDDGESESDLVPLAGPTGRSSLPFDPRELAELTTPERGKLYAEFGLDLCQREVAEDAVRRVIAGSYLRRGRR